MKPRTLLPGVLAFALLGCIAVAFVVGNAVTSDDDDSDPTPTSAAARPTARAVTLAEQSGTPVQTLGNTASTSGQPDASAVDVVARVGDAVVTVVNEQRGGLFGRSGLQPVGSGTGFIVDPAGYVVTNWHVVDGGDAFDVIFADGTRRPARLVGADRVSDLAVVQIDGPIPAVVPLGDSSLLLPGQPVLAIGSPLGSFTNTVTRGIVSALGRSLSDEPGQPELLGLIQHDAAINPGNSGGPLFNLAGEVVGVNTLGIPSDAQGRPVQGLFFAIPSNTVREIAADLIEAGRVEYPYLGIELIPITEELAAQNDLPVAFGVYVESVVSGGPADQAGVQPGDIILSLDGVSIDERRSITEVLFAHDPGETVQAEIHRVEETITVEITLATRPVEE